MTGTRRGPTIRRIRRTEWGKYREVRLRGLATDPLAFGSVVAEESQRPPEFWQERVQRGASAPDSSLWVLGRPYGPFLGTVTIFRVEGRFHVFGTWLDPALRGRGWGSRLLDTALRWFDRTAPGTPLTLEVNPRQGPAMALYRRRGFRPTGETRPLGHTAGEFVVELVRRPKMSGNARRGPSATSRARPSHPPQGSRAPAPRRRPRSRP